MNCSLGVNEGKEKKLLSEECIKCEDHLSIDDHLHCIHECNEWIMAQIDEFDNRDHLRRIHERAEEKEEVQEAVGLWQMS